MWLVWNSIDPFTTYNHLCIAKDSSIRSAHTHQPIYVRQHLCLSLQLKSQGKQSSDGFIICFRFPLFPHSGTLIPHPSLTLLRPNPQDWDIQSFRINKGGHRHLPKHNIKSISRTLRPLSSTHPPAHFPPTPNKTATRRRHSLRAESNQTSLQPTKSTSR